ncbi:MAG TPA: succinyl-diaminopimelate desuccinylase [Stellaceae bacterium]|nr:succinyl-diaminopimelate desuccinylase [Stellaceae bacterium]
MAAAASIDPAALTAELVRFASVTPKDEGCIAHLARTLERVGFACETLEFAEPGTEKILNLYARLGKSGRNLCFAGHTDVVPVGNRANWSVDPFAGTVKDGILIGRGAADMKSAIACFAAAAARFVTTHGHDFGGSLSLMITGDEEAIAINGTRKVLEALAKRGEKLDACIVGEPTSRKALGDMVKVGRRGSLNGYLTAFGVQGHTAYPHFADNAAHRLVKMLGELTREPIDDGSAQFEPSNLQVATIDIGNTAANIIPDRAKAVFNVRFNDRWNGKTMEAWVRQRLNRAGGKYELAIQVSGESFRVPPGEISDKLSRAIETITGRQPELSTGGGTSDARFIQRYCPVAEFGPVGETAHKVNECTSLNDIEALTKIYLSFLELYFGKR